MPRMKIRDIPYSFRPVRMGGSNDRYQATLPLPTNPPELSMGVFVKLGSDRSSYRHILNLATGTSDYVSIFHRNDIAQGAFTFRINQIEYTMPGREFRMDKWYCIVARTKAGEVPGELQMYIDGVLSREGNGKAPNLTNTIFDVGGTSSGAQKFDGLISSPFVIDRYITDDEIKAYSESIEYPDDCVGQWNLDEDMLGTAYDSSGNGNNLTRTGTPQYNLVSVDSPSKPRQLATGRLKDRDIKASWVSATNSRIENVPFTPSPDGFSFALWINTRSRISAGRILDYQNSGPVNGFTLINPGANPSEVRFILNNGTNNTSNLPTPTLPIGQWCHIAGTFSGTTARMYFNGEMVSESNTAEMAPASVPLSVGARSSSGSFNGNDALMSELVLHNTTVAWTPEQVRDLYLKGEIPQGVHRVYMLDEGAGNIAYDSSGNGEDATIINASYTGNSPMKSRQPINANMIYNGDFEFAPRVNVPQSTGFTWVDGSPGGSSSNRLFGYALYSYAGERQIMFDESEKYSGSHSFRVSTLAPNSRAAVYALRQSSDINGQNLSVFDLTPGVEYELTWRMKTRHVSGLAIGARCGVRQLRPAGTAVTQTFGTNVNTTTDWTRYSLIFTAAAEARFGSLELGVIGDQGGGQDLIMDAWFDDIELRPVVPVSRKLIN